MQCPDLRSDESEALEAVAGEFHGSPDEQIKAELFARLSKTNYIIEKIKDEYGIAFLREYKRFVGEPFEEPVVPGLVQVKVLGQGCPNCLTKIDRGTFTRWSWDMMRRRVRGRPIVA